MSYPHLPVGAPGIDEVHTYYGSPTGITNTVRVAVGMMPGSTEQFGAALAG